jgi:colanic acid biosynthesis glycosyl transferase WcaI
LTGISPLVTDAAEWLARRGHDLEVVAPLPNYPERRIQAEYRRRLWVSELRGGVRVQRTWLRARPDEGFLDKALYELTASTFGLPSILRRLRRADVLICVMPTLLAAAYATALPGRPRVVLWVQDLVLRGAEALELSRGARRLIGGARAIERKAVKGADRLVVCSPGFRDYFVRNGVEANKIDVVYNWVDLDLVRPTRSVDEDGPLRVLYAGNLGYSQGFETLIEAARIAGDRVSLRIVGEGNAARAVAQLAAGVANVSVQAPVPRSEFSDLLAEHDTHVVIQRRVSTEANLPSKIATYLASGRPVIGSIESGSSAGELLRESRGALIVEPESPGPLAEVMLRLSSDPKLRRELGQNARRFAEERLGKEAALRRFEASVVL